MSHGLRVLTVSRFILETDSSDEATHQDLADTLSVERPDFQDRDVSCV